DPTSLKVVPEWPLVYWWDEEMVRLYQSVPLIAETAPASKGICTGSDTRTLRSWWETSVKKAHWEPTIYGAKGLSWFEPLRLKINWKHNGLILHTMQENGQGTRFQ